jgi:hypothetical protein
MPSVTLLFVYLYDISFSFFIIILLLGISAFFLGKNIASVADTDPAKPNPFGAIGVLVSIVVPLLLVIFLIMLYMASLSEGGWSLITFIYYLLPLYGLFWIVAGLSAARAFELGWIPMDNWKVWFKRWISIVLSAIPSVFIFACALYIADQLLHHENISYYGIGVWLVPPILLLGILLAEVMHIGLAAGSLKSQQREWLSRFGAWILILALGWLIFSSAVFAGPFLIDQLFEYGIFGALVTSGWVSAIVAGLISGKGTSERNASGKIKDILISVAPYLFIAGLILFLSAGVQSLLYYYSPNGNTNEQITRIEKVSEPDRLVSGKITAQGDKYTLEASVTQPSVAYGWESRWNRHLTDMKNAENIDIILFWFLLAIFFTWLLSRRFDVNEFALHNMYKNRLARCYLGATTECRFSNPFTGFSIQDDIPLWIEKETREGGFKYHLGLSDREINTLWFSKDKEVDARKKHNKKQELASAYPGPYPLINTAINLVKGKRLAWQERKAAPFLFSPLYCGFQLPPHALEDERCLRERQGEGSVHRDKCNFCIRRFIDDIELLSSDRQCPFDPDKKIKECFNPTEHSADCDASDAAYFRPTREYASDVASNMLTLGDAMAISGAAASPNMGYHTKPAFSFLMAVFNVRLGRWIGNPMKQYWRNSSPGFALYYLLCEVFGLTNEHSKFIYLSDGGHFDNLGIYELIRRHCRFIIASDAGADPDYRFDDLANTIRKCRIDLGVDIDLDITEIQRRDESGNNIVPCSLGNIHYPTGETGTILYIKASRLSNIPTDVYHYALEHSIFPHQSTADQFFSESQFESYRRLGIYIGDYCLADAVAQAQDAKQYLNIGRLFRLLRQKWFKRSLFIENHFTKHSQTLVSLLTELGNRKELAFLDKQFYPECRVIPTMGADLSQDDRTDHDTDIYKQVSQAQKRHGLRIPSNYCDFRAGFYFCNALIQLMENVYIDLNLEEDYSHPDNSGWINLFRHWAWSDMFRVTWSICASTYGRRFRSFCVGHLNMDFGRIGFKKSSFTDLMNNTASLLFNQNEMRQLDHIKHTLKVPERVTVYQFNLHTQRSDELDIQSTESRASRPCESLAQGESIFRFFCFGYALVEDNRLIMLRVRDHLRRMDLGTRALCLLFNEYGQVLELDDERAVSLLQELDPPAVDEHMSNFVAMFHSIKMENRG